MMPGDVEFLDAARRVRALADGHPARATTAADYVRHAEEALSLLPTLAEPGERAAVRRIVETWLALAESELEKPR